MASLRKKKTVSGYEINVPEKCIVGEKSQLTMHTFKQRKSEAEDVLLAVKIRISKVKNGEIDISDWDRNERKEWLRTGSQPVRLRTEELTLFSCIEQYLEDCERNNAHSTLVGYKNHLKRAKEFFEDIPLSSIKRKNVQNFVNWMSRQIVNDGKNRGQLLSVESLKSDVAQLKRVFSWANGEDDTINLSVFKVRYPKKATTIFDYLTAFDDFATRQKDLTKHQIDESAEGAYRKIIYGKKELANNLQYLKQTQWDDGTFDTRRLFVAILVCSCTGARRSELCRVKRRDLDLPNKAITIWMRKGSKDVDLKPHRRELLNDAIPFLKALLFQTPQNQECIFCSDDNHMLGASWDQGLEQKKWHSLTKALKKSLKKSVYFNVNGFHVYRHTLASTLLIEGYSQAEVKETIGWCTDEMAQRYQHLTRDRRRSTLETIRDVVPSITINN